MEGRHTRRLVRYWVFLSIAYLFGVGAYFYYGVLHALFSSVSATVGMIGPRYLMGAIALYYLTGFVLGFVFLGFDVRARDIREGIVEVLDSRPLTNLELILGRFVALFLAGWVPIVVMAILIQGLGWLLPLLGSPIGRTVEPLSLVNFVGPMAVPAIAFAIASVFVITLLVRHRLLAALISIGAIVALYWALFSVPTSHSAFFDYAGTTWAGMPSDLVPAMMVPGGMLHRIGFLVLALGLLGVAAAIHPRLDGSRRLQPAAAALALAAVGVVLISLTVRGRVVEAEQVATWQAAHEARADEPVADILSVDGRVTVDPGRTLSAELVVDVGAPADRALERVLLTLNPGLAVDEVRAASGAALDFVQANGLLDIELDRALRAGERTSLTLRYAGHPNVLFAYLDSTFDLSSMDLNEAQITLLGYDAGIFDRRFVALMPGIRWLPAAGVDVRRDDSRDRPTDYFDIELDVEVPRSWLAAGPGKRVTVGSTDETVTFRFAPGTAVPEVAIVAGELESFATEIDGITFEALVHPKHTRNFEVLADARGEVEAWIADRLDVAAEAGLAYPFDAFTIVEVPNSLRGYGGGWRLDTTLAPPAMMLVRETSFPTARFDFDVRAAFGNFDPNAQEGGAPRVQRDRLVSFFTNDFSGGNVFTGAARSFFAHRTSAVGPEALALDFVLEELATLLVSGQRSYFSALLFKNINQASADVVGRMQTSGGSLTDAMIASRTRQPDLWNTALDTPLSDIDPWDDPQHTLDLLALKGGEMAQAIYDALGPQAVGELLAGLLERRAGESFTFADFTAAAAEIDPDLSGMFAEWIDGTGMAGFVAERVEVYRLPDSGSGDDRYQLIVRVANHEPVVGFARVAWTMERGGQRAFGPPVRIPGQSAVEFGAVLSQPPAVVYVHPYLSLNRGPFLAGLTDLAEPRLRDAEPFDGVRDAVLGELADERIVADDLDAGFTFVDDDTGDDLRLVGRGAPVAGLDEGLPLASGPLAPAEWSRGINETAWGRYRHTFASVRAGEGRRRAVMPVSIPARGLWELELHLPYLPTLPPQNRGTWKLAVVSANGRDEISWDATAANIGWNLVGQFELPAGDVRVELSDETDGRLVVADAIGWSPVRIERVTNDTGSDR